MSISNMTPEVKDTLELVGITTIVHITDSEEEAVSSMA